MIASLRSFEAKKGVQLCRLNPNNFNWHKAIDITNRMTKVVNSDNDPYVEYVASLPWDFFCTFTTRYKLTLPSARRLMGRLHDRLSSEVSKNRLFWVAEPFDCKEGYHCHGLLYLQDQQYNERGIDFSLVKTTYEIVSGGKKGGKSMANTHLSRYNAKKGAARYCGKYLLKTNADYDILNS